MKVKCIDGVYSVERESKYDIIIEIIQKLQPELSKINKTIDRLAEKEAEKSNPDDYYNNMYAMCYLQVKAEGMAEAMKPMIKEIEELYNKKIAK